MELFKELGKSPSGERLEKIKNQPNYNDGRFHNLEPTAVNPGDVSFFKILKEFLTRPKTVTPSGEIPSHKTDLFNLPSEEISIIWFGHSSYLINYRGYTVLVDPVFSGYASPVKFFGKAFKGTNIYSPEDFPEIDLLLLTHDHYDHLDYKFIVGIQGKVKRVLCSLGVGEHLEHWKIDPTRITELAWNENVKVNSYLKVTALPSRHFSSRGTTRFITLWSSFALVWNDFKIFVGGDSGYSKQFAEIGEKFEGFDLAFLECGQYSKYWPEIHMMPEQTVQAGVDLNAKTVIPVHWGKFVLSIHPWDEPIKRFVASAKQSGQRYLAPEIGQVVIMDKYFEQKEWWNFEKKNNEE